MSYVIDCPECGADSSVIDSRESEVDGFRNGSRRRRRECVKCSSRFTTYELSRKTIENMDHIHMLLVDLIKSAKCFEVSK